MNKISLIKKTLGKDGKYYFYESLSSVQNIEDVHWYRTDESFFNHLLKTYEKSAIKTEHNENGEIIYMEYLYEKKQYDGNTISEEELKNDEKGCRLSLILAVIVLIIVLIIILF